MTKSEIFFLHVSLKISTLHATRTGDSFAVLKPKRLRIQFTHVADIVFNFNDK